MLSRQTLRKIAALGHESLCPGRRTPLVDARARRRFLTVVWGRMMQARGLLDGSGGSLAAVINELARLLDRVPRPVSLPGWGFFTNGRDDLGPIEPFWQALGAERWNTVWQSSDAPGWLYQYFLEPGLEPFRSAAAPKINAEQLALRTQQFTPPWIADFLAQNTLGRLWVSMHPDSRLASSWHYLVPATTDLPPVEPKKVRDIKVLDPACGCMHLGLSALTLLREMYREETDRAGRTGWPAEPSAAEGDSSDAIVQNNLFGIDIDPSAIELAALTLFHAAHGKLCRPPRLLCTDGLKKNLPGRLRTHGFPDRFDVLLLNPPYLDKRDYHARLKSFMGRHYPHSGRNLYTAFLEQSLRLLAPGGRLGAVTPQTFMFIRSYQALRRKLLELGELETLVHTGLNTFDDAVVDCAFYVLRRENNERVRNQNTSRFFQITSPTTSEDKHRRLKESLAELRRQPAATVTHCHHYRPGDFAALPDHPWVYWISPRIRELFTRLPALGQIAKLRQGLATTDNNRFLRYWWEIPHDQIAWNCRSLAEAGASGKTWFPYMKGGQYNKWYGNREYLVNWRDDGREIKAEITRRYPYLKGDWQWVAKNTEYYFREGITYSYLTSGKFSARWSPAGSIFDVAGSSIFCDRPELVLAILNSRWCRFALGLINPTVNFQVGDLQRLPVPDVPCPTDVKALVAEAIELAQSLEAFEETSPDFVAPPPWPDGRKVIQAKKRRLTEIQKQIDQQVYRLYNLGRQDRQLIEHHTPPDHQPPTPSRRDLAHQWIAHAVGHALGRFSSSSGPGGMASSSRPCLGTHSGLLSPIAVGNDQGLVYRVRQILEQLLALKDIDQIIRQACPDGSLAGYLSRPFFDRHFQDYHRRPIYWLIKRKSTLYALYYQNLTADNLKEILPPSRRPKEFHFDHGIPANMKPFRPYLAISSWKRHLQEK